MTDGVLYEKLIYENEAKFYQLRLTVSEFRGLQYVNVRKYFLTYEGDYQASKDGVSMEACMTNVFNLLDGLMEIASLEESKDAITKHFGQRILDLQKPTD